MLGLRSRPAGPALDNCNGSSPTCYQSAETRLSLLFGSRHATTSWQLSFDGHVHGCHQGNLRHQRQLAPWSHRILRKDGYNMMLSSDCCEPYVCPCATAAWRGCLFKSDKILTFHQYGNFWSCWTQNSPSFANKSTNIKAKCCMVAKIISMMPDCFDLAYSNVLFKYMHAYVRPWLTPRRRDNGL